MSRREFQIGPDNRTAVCFTSDETRGPHIERWELGRSGEWRATGMVCAATHPQMMPGENGAVFVFDSDNPAAGITVYESDGRQRTLAAPGYLRFVSMPRAEVCGFAMVHSETHSELWRFAGDEPVLRERLVRVPGLSLSVYPLDPRRRLLAIDHSDFFGDDGEILVVDTEDGSCSTMLEHAQVLLTHPATGLIMVRVTVDGSRWVGWRRLAESGPLRFPPALNPARAPAQPVAVRPDGREVLVHDLIGARSRLRRYDLDADVSVDVPTPAGVVRQPVRWSGERISLSLSTPDRAPRLVTMGQAERGGGLARVERVRGATGPIESIVYGGRNWRDNPRLVLAVHGGPHSAWRYEFVPLLHALAEQGVAVLAPNQRGSVGYGPEHAAAIVGALGRADLADLLVIAEDLRRYRDERGLPPLRLVGESYGAYLALLAAGQAPGYWSHCAVLAPFLSPERLAEQGIAGVRALLAGLRPAGAPDVLDSCDRISAELFVAHGRKDAVVPVSESAALVARLRAGGRAPHYLEVAEGDHELTVAEHSGVTRSVAAFLAAPAHSEGGETDGYPNRKSGLDGRRGGVAAASRGEPGCR